MIHQNGIFLQWLAVMVSIESSGAEVASAWLQLLSIYKCRLKCFLTSYNHFNLTTWLDFELGMVLLDTNTTQDNLIGIALILSSNLDVFFAQLSEIIMNLAAQLGILVQIGQMRSPLICQLLVLLFLYLSSTFRFVFFTLFLEPLFPSLLHVVQFLLGMIHLVCDILSITKVQIFPIDDSATFSSSIPQDFRESLILCPQLSDDFVLDTLIYNSFIDNFLGSISVSQS